jgi:phage regulator Rha-like protein
MKQISNLSTARIESLIIMLRGERVILDTELAQLYGVETRVLNQAVKRNSEKFPEDFSFQLTDKEIEQMRSQNATASETLHKMRSQIVTASKRNIRYRPYVFTEHGAIMAANVLNSKQAVQMSVFVVRAFVKMRSFLSERSDLAKELKNLEEKLTKRLDVHEVAIVDVLRRITRLLEPPPPLHEIPKRKIGF